MSQPVLRLETILEGYNAATIKEMLAGLSKQPKAGKAENVTWLATEFSRPERVRQQLGQLNEAEKIVLARLQEQGGQLSYTRLRQMMSLHPDLLQKSHSTKTIYVNGERQPAYEARPVYKDKPTFENLLAGLARKGLVFSQQPLEDGRTTLDWLPGRTILLPEYVRTPLKSITLPELPNPAAIEPVHVVSSSAQTFLRDLGRYGRYLRRKGTLQFTTQNQLYKEDLKAIAAEMSFKSDLGSGKKEMDNGRLYFLRCLLPKVELAVQKYTTDPLTAVPDSPFWQLTLADRAQLAFHAWRDQGAWYELPNLQHFQRGGTAIFGARELQALANSRKVILRHAAKMGRGWINIEELIEVIKNEDYGFLFENRKATRWSYYNARITVYDGGSNQYAATFGPIKDDKDGWNKVEAHLINHVIAGPLHWMGLVELGYMEKPPLDLRGNQRVAGYRLTPMGEWLLGVGPKPEFASGEGHVVVQPNFEIVVMAPFDDEVLLTVDHFAQTVKESDHVITYEINRASVYNGQKQGWPVERMIGWLERSSKQPLPQNVRRSLEEWDALHRRITIRPQVRLLETADPTIADQIAPLLPTGQTRRVTPTVFLSKETADHLTGSLRQADWLPLRTTAGVTTAPNSVQIDRDGRIRYSHATPSIYAQGIIRPLSADTGHGRELTAMQVKAAVSQGRALPEIIASLQAIHAGPLPDSLIIKLKAWSHYYGNARLGTFTLIEFKDVATRDELLKDPEVSQYLLPFAADGRALASVQPQNLPTLHALLAERGVKLEESLKE